MQPLDKKQSFEIDNPDYLLSGFIFSIIGYDCYGSGDETLNSIFNRISKIPQSLSSDLWLKYGTKIFWLLDFSYQCISVL